MPRPSVGVISGSADWPLPGLQAVSDLAEVRRVEGPDDVADVEAVFVWDFRASQFARRWPFQGLRWVHAGSVGVDAIMTPELAASDIMVTNTRGVFERPIAEYVLGMLLAFAKDLPQTLALQRQRAWRHRENELLCGRRAVVLGAGAIGREISRMMSVVGINVTAVGRTARQGVPDVGNVHAMAEVDDLLSEADIVVVALPLTRSTIGLLDASRLEHIRRGAWLVNIGRGAVIDERALLEALRSGRIARAALDVFEQEPLPSEHPFWTMEQVIVSPHMAGDTVGWGEAVVCAFVENLRRWCNGDPLLHVVDKQALQR